MGLLYTGASILYAVLSPLVTDPLAPPGDPESSLFLTCHFVFVARRKQNEARIRLIHFLIPPDRLKWYSYAS